MTIVVGDANGAFHELVLRLLEYFKDLGRQVKEMERQIQSWQRANAT